MEKSNTESVLPCKIKKVDPPIIFKKDDFTEYYIANCEDVNVVVKEIKFNLSQDEEEILKKNLNSLNQISNIYIMDIFGCYLTKDKIYLVTEFCKDNLSRIVESKRFLSIDQKLKIIRDIAYSLDYFHAKFPGICYGDLSSKNIYFKNKILDCDLKFKLKIKETVKCLFPNRSNLMDYKNSLNLDIIYSSPEMLMGKIDKISGKSDIFSYGILMWEIFALQSPYKEKKMCPFVLMTEIINNNLRPNLSILQKDTPKQIIDLMQICWDSSIEKRPSSQQIIEILYKIENEYFKSEIENKINSMNNEKEDKIKEEKTKIKIKIGEYILYDVLNVECFGNIYECQSLSFPEQKFIAKQFKINKLQDKNILDFKTEIEILKMCDHENIVKFKNLLKSEDSYYLIIESPNGATLQEIINYNGGKLKEDQIQYIMRGIFKALYYLKSKNVVHRDLKLNNIMLNFNSDKDLIENNLFKATIKITGFELGQILPAEGISKDIVGTPIFCDPIILKALKNKETKTSLGYNEKVDLWSSGIICCNLLTGKAPFYGSNLLEFINSVDEAEYIIPVENNISCEIISFLNSILKYHINERFPVEDLIKHKFLVNSPESFTIIKFENNSITKEIKLNTKDNKLKNGVYNNMFEKSKSIFDLGKNSNLGNTEDIFMWDFSQDGDNLHTEEINFNDKLHYNDED